MVAEQEISGRLAELKQKSPAGYAIALHIKFTTPTFLFQTYPKSWLKYYSEKGLVMHDPTVHWGFANEGSVDWSSLAEEDTAGVIKHAAEHGMTYGLTCAVAVDEDRSIASFSRSDRPITEAEAAEFHAHLEALHEATDTLRVLPAETAEQLRALSVQVTHPNS